MDVKKKLAEAVEKNIITFEQRIKLSELFFGSSSLQSNESYIRFSTEAFLYYFGSFIILCAMAFFMFNTITGSTFVKIFCLGSFYAFLFARLGEYLWKKSEKLPASLLFFLCVTMIVFLIMVIEKATGFFPHFSEAGKYANFYTACRPALLSLALSSILVGGFVLKKRTDPLQTIPIICGSYSLFLMIGPMITGNFTNITETNFLWINLIYSIVLVAAAIKLDRKSEVDYSLWPYICGSFSLYYSIIFLLDKYINDVDSEIIPFMFGFIGLVYILASLILKRKSFMILGVLGFVGYVFYLEFKFIENSPILLAAIILITGLIVFYAGILYHQNKEIIYTYIEKYVPQNLKKFLIK